MINMMNYNTLLEKTLAEVLNDENVVTSKEFATINIKVPRLLGETDEEFEKRFPKYAHDGDIGMDITAIGMDYDELHDCYVYHTGIYCESPRDIGCFLMPRSSNAKTDAYLTNSIGLIDTYTYRGELMLKFKNRTDWYSIVHDQVISEYLQLSWWKKLTFDYTKCFMKHHSHFIEHFDDYAPYEVGDRIAQMVWVRFPKIDLNVVDKLSETDRGEGGFGSTGK